MRWGAEVRECRWSQPLLLADGAGTALPPAGLRAARPGEEDAVFPAAVAMFREEVGVDPLAAVAGRSYRRRATELIRAGRTYIVTRERRVVFKAGVGARSEEHTSGLQSRGQIVCRLLAERKEAT